MGTRWATWPAKLWLAFAVVVEIPARGERWQPPSPQQPPPWERNGKHSFLPRIHSWPSLPSTTPPPPLSSQLSPGRALSTPDLGAKRTSEFSIMLQGHFLRSSPQFEKVQRSCPEVSSLLRCTLLHCSSCHSRCQEMDFPPQKCSRASDPTFSARPPPPGPSLGCARQPVRSSGEKMRRKQMQRWGEGEREEAFYVNTESKLAEISDFRIEFDWIALVFSVDQQWLAPCKCFSLFFLDSL